VSISQYNKYILNISYVFSFYNRARSIGVVLQNGLGVVLQNGLGFDTGSPPRIPNPAILSFVGLAFNGEFIILEHGAVLSPAK
jgi:hypothetical protein